jgi:hypothetical protein
MGDIVNCQFPDTRNARNRCLDNLMESREIGGGDLRLDSLKSIRCSSSASSENARRSMG